MLDALRAAALDVSVSGDTAWSPVCAGCFAYDLLEAYEPLPPDGYLALTHELIDTYA